MQDVVFSTHLFSCADLDRWTNVFKLKWFNQQCHEMELHWTSKKWNILNLKSIQTIYYTPSFDISSPVFATHPQWMGSDGVHESTLRNNLIPTWGCLHHTCFLSCAWSPSLTCLDMSAAWHWQRQPHFPPCQAARMQLNNVTRSWTLEHFQGRSNDSFPPSGEKLSAWEKVPPELKSQQFCFALQ